MKRNKFNLSHYKLLTCDMGQLIPIAWYETLPGDTFQLSTSALIRVSPLVAPVMHPVKVRIHHWFVPNRLLWDNWEDFITGGPDGMDESVWPCMGEDIDEGDLGDYLGLPALGTPTWVYSALPFRAYNLIYNHWYRDQALCDERDISLDDGVDSTTDISIAHCAWEKDYYTTARPFEQLGTGVTIPLGESADVVGKAGTGPRFRTATTPITNIALQQHASYGVYANPAGDVGDTLLWNGTDLKADLTTATGISINDLRLALGIQKYQEARALYGSRYTEYLRYLGVRSSDARLGNPEYLGGGKQTIQFSEVVQTSGETGGNPLGTLGGHGISAMRTNRFRKFFEEHGIIMTLMSVIPKPVYTFHVERKWYRPTKEHYFQRELQHIGEQEIPNWEVMSAHSSPLDLFGYQARYDEYRSHLSGVSGEFLSDKTNWHYSRMFLSDIALNQSFVEATPTKRVNADQDAHCLQVMANHNCVARRMLSKRGTPRTF